MVTVPAPRLCLSAREAASALHEEVASPVGSECYAEPQDLLAQHLAAGIQDDDVAGARIVGIAYGST